MCELAKSLETKETEIVLVEEDIKQLETNVQDRFINPVAELLIVSQ